MAGSRAATGPGKATPPDSEGDTGAGTFYWLAILGVLNSAVSVYYYLRVTVLMYFRESEREITGLQFSPASVFALILAVIGTLYMGIFPANVLSLAQRSIAGLM